MMIVGTDSTGKVLMTADGEDVSVIPVVLNGIQINATQLNEKQVSDFLALPQVRAGTLFTNGTFTAINIPSPSLLSVQTDANAAIDAQAGATRLKYITDVAGQSETYLSKANDAAAYKTANYPVASIANYPMVQAEGKALNGATPTAAQYQAAADGILAQQAQWIALAAAIEQQRRGGKIAVGNATTVAAVQAAQQAAITALQAL